MLIIFFLINAAILGSIIAVMEEGEFPGWVVMIACVAAAVIPAAIVNAFLPPIFFFVGLTVGAVCAGCAISATCGMSAKRAVIAASIYLAINVCISLGFQFLMA